MNGYVVSQFVYIISGREGFIILAIHRGNVKANLKLYFIYV